MCLPFDEIVKYLHYYAGIFQNNRIEHDELVNEAWIRVYPLKTIEFASQGIRWAMKIYIKNQMMQDHRRNTQSKIQSIDQENAENLFCKDILVAPKNNQKQTFEDKEYIHHLLRNPNLALADRLLIDQRYYQGLYLKDMAEIHGCAKGNIVFRLNMIVDKLKYITGAA